MCDFTSSEKHPSLISVTFFRGAFPELALCTEHLSVSLVGSEPWKPWKPWAPSSPGEELPQTLEPF